MKTAQWNLKLMTSNISNERLPDVAPIQTYVGDRISEMRDEFSSLDEEIKQNTNLFNLLKQMELLVQKFIIQLLQQFQLDYKLEPLQETLFYLINMKELLQN